MISSSNLHYITKTGNGIAEVFDDLAQVRIAVFHDFPYLYEGSVEYEKAYLKIYSESSRAFLFGVYDGGQMVGATTCIPLIDESAEIRKPFHEQGYDVEKIFYFGESILLPEYRGLGLGHRFFDERERHVQDLGNYDLCCFCSVERDVNHPAKPDNYRPNDIFWEKRGYRRDQSLTTMMSWPDIGESASTPKKMVFWTKQI